jgi:hypothetical protein
LVGELKYLEGARAADTLRVVRELRDYLSIASEPTSDWGHDFGYGFIYEFGGGEYLTATEVIDYWRSDRIFLTRMAAE